MAIKIRKADERRYFDYEWLKTCHTFSFGQYYDPQYMGFRSLRVLNENYIQPAVGFPLQLHRDMEIMSVILEGGLAHQDDMGNGAVLRPGYVQLMSAGRGMTHTEINASDKEIVHFIQFWIVPDKKGLEPNYQEKFFLDSMRENQWALIASQDGRQESLKIHQNVEIYLTDLDAGHSLSRDIAEGRFGWLQVLQGGIHLNEMSVEAGDGAAISQTPHFDIQAQSFTKLLFLDLN